MTISRSLRFSILRRDQHTCQYCGARAPDVELTVDHVIPTALGGSDDPSNLVTACQPCNAGKGTTPPDAPLVEAVAKDALRWRAAIEEAARLRMLEEDAVRGDLDKVWEAIAKDYGSVDWETTCRRFLSRGLTADQMVLAGRQAIGRSDVATSRVWNYFCGICWNRVTDLEEDARRIIEDQDAAK